MQQKMKSTVIKLKNEQLISFRRVISYTKFGYNALFQSNSIQGSQQNRQTKYYDVYAFSKSLLQINNLKNHIEQIIKLYSKLNNSRVLCPIVQKIEEKDMFYLISQTQRYSLKELIEKRQGLTEYEVTYFIMELFQILNYCKSREIYFQKLQLSNLYLNNDMKLSLPFNMFLNKAVNKPMMKRLPFRNQAKNRNNCPQLFSNSNSQKQTEKEQFETKTDQRLKQQKQQIAININLVNSWNLGVLVYELLQNCKPFSVNCSTSIVGNNALLHDKKELIYHENESKKFYILKFYQTQSQEAKQFITKLLQVDVKKRLNFPLILIESIFKKMEQIPHILPSTILTCPPSQEFKQSYRKNFSKQQKVNQQKQQTQNKGTNQHLQPNNARSLKKRNDIIRTQIIIKSTNCNLMQIDQNANQKQMIPHRQSLDEGISHIDPQQFKPSHQTQNYIKAEERSLTQNKIYVEQFVDISHAYGFGYQMNTGTLCFVYNDQTQFYFPNSNRKYLVYVNEKKGITTYTYDKLPEEEDLKKKIFILEAYSKSIKKFKNPTQLTSSSPNQKTVTVLRYGKTKHASMFYLSNDSVQVFFNDKICFLMTKSNLYVLSKNNDKYEKYDYRNQTNEMKTRRDYVIAMAKKIFGWKKDKILEDSQNEEHRPEIDMNRHPKNRKNSILRELSESGSTNRDQRLQSLKKMKEMQQRNYRLMKKGIISHDKLQSQPDDQY